jgi:hypothetical protein
MANTPVPPMLDNPVSPDIFADFAVGAVVIAGCLRITLASNRNDYTTTPPTARNVIIGRLVMPIVGAENLLEFVGEYLKQLKDAGGSAPPAAVPQRLN